MTRRTALRSALGALAVGLVAVIAVPAASGQAGDGVLTVRGIDATDAEAVRLTFGWSGPPDALSKMTLREDGVAKQIDDLSDLRKTDQRLGTVVVVDVSGSMANDGALTRTKAGLARLVDTLAEGDQMAIVSFTDTVAVETAFSSDTAQLEAAVDGLIAPSDGKTAMYDGLRKATSLFADRPDLQPNLVLVTDGWDDASTATLDETKAAIVSSGAALYAVDLTHADQTDLESINTIINRTGGTVVSGTTDAEIDQAFIDLATAVNSQYVATYASAEDQGSVNVTIGIGGSEQAVSYVVGVKAQGAATSQVVPAQKAFGPDWMRSSTGALMAFVLVGLAVGLGAYSFASLATKNDTGLSAMLSPYSEDGQPIEGDGALAQTALLQRAVELTEDFAERQGLLKKVEYMLERADLPLRAAEALFFYVAGVLVLAVGAVFGLGLIPGILVTFLLALLPPAFVNFTASRRGKKFVTLLPDTLSLLSGSLRAGYSLMQGVEAVSQEVEEPMGKELRRVVTEARLGREIEDSMDGVAERMDSPDFAWAVMAVRIQREVGGNLAELLLTVADTMIQRDRLRRDISALTAEGKISAIILGLLPIGLGGFMWLSNPTYMAPLGNTGLGQVLLVVASVSALAGFAWMKKIINIKI